MLILTRKPGESVCIGPDVRVTVLGSSGGQVRLGIDAPEHVAVHRHEVYERIEAANREAADAALASLDAFPPRPGDDDAAEDTR